MKIKDYLNNEQKMRMKSLIHKNKPPSKEKLSRKDWEEIMGTNRDIYKRVRGAIRRK